MSEQFRIGKEQSAQKRKQFAESQHRELRLWLDEPNEKVNTPLPTQKAIDDCIRINSSGNQWARLLVVPTPIGPIVHLEVGNILSDGFKECRIQTWLYTQEKDGSVSVFKQTHS